MQCAIHHFEILHIALVVHDPEGDKREHVLGKISVEADLS